MPYGQTNGADGMTLRDYFAAKAMSGWLASYPRDMDVQLAANGAHVVASFAYVIADAMLEHGVSVIAFSFPVVPVGKARIRVQMSAAHSEDDVRRCVEAFTAARAQVG